MADSIFYTINYFNMAAVRSYLRVFAKNEDDVFANHHEFMKKHKVEPPEDLYLFFYFDGIKTVHMIEFLDNNFPDYNYVAISFLHLLQKKDEFKDFTYRYLLEPFEDKVNIENVLQGDEQSVSKAIALLSSEHQEYPMLVFKLFFEFDKLVDLLISYFKLIFPNIDIFCMGKADKKVNAYEKAVDEFLNSEHVDDYFKTCYINKKIELREKKYAVSFFRSFIIKTPPKMDDNSTVIIGDKCKNTSKICTNYMHITKATASIIFATPVAFDIINALKKGEKSITQLSNMMNHSRQNIDKYVTMLRNQHAIKRSHKSGNECFYEINYPYFRAAENVLRKACKDIYDNEK